MNPTSIASVPLNDSKDSGSVHAVPYDIARVISVSREEWRRQCLHDMARIFESAFGGAQ